MKQTWLHSMTAKWFSVVWGADSYTSDAAPAMPAADQATIKATST